MIKGVDLSCWNTNVDYQALKDSGVEFAILRIGYGKDDGQRDTMFDEHYRGCKDVGIKVGAYHYSYCTKTENAEKEAENCLRYLDGIILDLPVFYDLEDKTIINNNVDIELIAEQFCDKIKESGYNAGVYANLNWFKNYLDANKLKRLGNYIWMAQWNSTMDANFEVDIWQNTNKNEFGYDGDILINERLIDNSEIVEPELKCNLCQSLAVDVIYGLYGNGIERKNNLGVYYEEVQEIVNKIYDIIKEN